MRPQMEEQRAGKHTDLPDFIFSFFQKRVGIPTAVVEVRLPDALDGVLCLHALAWPCHSYVTLLGYCRHRFRLKCCTSSSCLAALHAVLHAVQLQAHPHAVKSATQQPCMHADGVQPAIRPVQSVL